MTNGKTNHERTCIERIKNGEFSGLPCYWRVTLEDLCENNIHHLTCDTVVKARICEVIPSDEGFWWGFPPSNFDQPNYFWYKILLAQKDELKSNNIGWQPFSRCFCFLSASRLLPIAIELASPSGWYLKSLAIHHSPSKFNSSPLEKWPSPKRKFSSSFPFRGKFAVKLRGCKGAFLLVKPLTIPKKNISLQ